MLYLTRSTVNRVYLKLRDLSTFDDPVFLIKFKSELTLDTAEVMVDDLSVRPSWFQEFDIELPGDIDLVAGDYLYSAYETDGETENLLKVGICRVKSE